MMGGRVTVIQVLTLSLLLIFPNLAFAQLRHNYYAHICQDVETIVRSAIAKRFHRLTETIPKTLYLFFSDCFVQGCDASILIASTESNRAEIDHDDNMALIYAGDAREVVTEAKAAVDAVASCRNKVSCADILAMAARDVIVLAGGQWYPVELGRLDGLSSTAASVDGKLPQKNMNLDQLNAIFAANGFTQAEMIALSGAHTVGETECYLIMDRLYNFSKQNPVDPTLNSTLAAELKENCQYGKEPDYMLRMDDTPEDFDNMYYKNLLQGKGIFTSDQVLFTDSRSKQTVISFASHPQAFSNAFTMAITKLGRLGVKTGQNGNIRRNCSAFN